MADGAERACPAMRLMVRDAYGSGDLSAAPVRAGGFINFVYWRGIDLGRPLGEAERIRGQENLYRLVLGCAGPLEGLSVVEVGCGIGMGCALALRERGPGALVGTDIHPQRLRRARDAQAGLLRQEPQRLRFVLGARRGCRSRTASPTPSSVWRRLSASRT